MEIKTVLKRKDGVKYIIVPLHSDIKSGDKVLITNNLKLISKFIKEEEKNDKGRKKGN